MPFYVEPILLELESGMHVGLLLPATLAKLVSGRRRSGGGSSSGGGGGGGDSGSGCGGSGSDGGGSSGSGRNGGKGGGAGWGGVGTGYEGSGGPVGVRVCYEAHLPTLYVWDGEKLHTIMVGMVFPMVQVNVLCKNWHMCGMF